MRVLFRSKVGGLGFPFSFPLVAGYGAPMPDGNKSAGVLIGAPAGTTVTAVADGTVVFSEWMTGYGLILIIDHGNGYRSEEHTSELQSLMRISYAVFCLKNKILTVI